MEPIRVLHVFGELNVGGAESRTMDIYRHIDRKKVQFDFLVHTEKIGFFEAEIESLGGKIYRIPRFGIKSLFSYKKALHDFFKKHTEYKIVHGHMLSTAFIYQGIAKKYDVPIRIAHSRCGSRTELNFENIVKEIFKRFVRFYVTDKFAVSEIAAISAFGRHDVRNNKVKILPNAIQTEKYKFNECIRNKIRKELNAADKFIVGHIGRFQQQKNHKFLIKIFYELQKQIPDSLLLLVGDGELKNEIMQLVDSLGLEKKVIFTGVRSDVPYLLQAMDVLLFPSFFEGFPGVVLEAQAAGLPCVISDTITKEVKLTNIVKYVSLNDDVKNWIQAIIDITKNYDRKDIHRQVIEAGYDVKTIAKWYEQFYLDVYDVATRM